MYNSDTETFYRRTIEEMSSLHNFAMIKFLPDYFSQIVTQTLGLLQKCGYRSLLKRKKKQQQKLMAKNDPH